MIEIDLRHYKLQHTQREENNSFLGFRGMDYGRIIKNTSKEWSSKKKQHFFQDLAILLGSGVDLSMSLQVMVDSTNVQSEKKALSEIIESLIKGKSFADTLKKTNNFSAYEYHCIRIGEEKSRLQEILIELSSFHLNRIAQKRKILSAFSYPIIVIITAIAAMTFMLSYIVPMFQDIFMRFHRELPALTLFIIKISNNLKLIASSFTLISVGLVVLHFVYRNNEWYMKLISTIVLSIPVFGKLIRQIQLAKFCLIMELLLSSKTHIIESLNLSESIVKFYHFREAIKQISANVLKGKSLSASMMNFKIFDARMIALIKVSEEVNQLEKVFKQLKEQYNKDVEYQSGVLNNVLEPVLILFIGLVVGLILIAMYLPIFQISSSIM